MDTDMLSTVNIGDRIEFGGRWLLVIGIQTHAHLSGWLTLAIQGQTRPYNFPAHRVFSIRRADGGKE